MLFLDTKAMSKEKILRLFGDNQSVSVISDLNDLSQYKSEVIIHILHDLNDIYLTLSLKNEYRNIVMVSFDYKLVKQIKAKQKSTTIPVIWINNVEEVLAAFKQVNCLKEAS